MPSIISSSKITNEMVEQTNNIEIFKMFPLLFLTLFVIIFFYKCFLLSKFGATPGKMLLSIKVVDENTNENISLFKAFCREVPAKILSGFFFCIGYLMAAFREDDKALHDLLCSTRVVKN